MADDPVVAMPVAMTDMGGSGQTGQGVIGPSTRKLTKAEAGYAPDGGSAGHRCGDCRFFQNGGCILVEGEISPDAVCDEFEPSYNRGNMTAAEASAQAEVQMPEPTLPPEPMKSTAALDMFITRVSKPEKGKRRWYATSSGVKRDLYGERMSVDLFRDFVRRIRHSDPVPDPFASAAWKGGNPYLSVAHYLDLDGAGIAGATERVWIDGSHLKCRGTFEDNALGDAAYASIERDIAESRPSDQRVRVSIAFIDWGHSHEGKGHFQRKSLVDRCQMCDDGVAGKVYRFGQLVHNALTRRPAYPETTILLEERSMTTRRDDAASIVGAELADDLEKRTKGLTERTAGVAAGAVVVREGEYMKDADKDHGMASGTASDMPPEDTAKGEMMSGQSLASDLPFGGARTLDDAEVYLERSSAPVLDAYAILSGVLENIVGNEEGKAAVREAVAGFRERVDAQAVDALMEVRQFLKQGGNAMSGKTGEEKPAEKAAEVAVAATTQTPAPALDGTHPLDAALLSLRGVYDEALQSGGDFAARVALVQPAINGLAEKIEQTIAPAAAAGVGVSPAELQRMIDSSVQKAFGPMQGVLAGLAAAGSGVKKDQTMTRRAFRPTGAPSIPAGAGDGKPVSGLKGLVRRSVGLRN